MHDDARVEFFNGIAGDWDGWEDMDRLRAGLDDGLREFGVGPGETVADIGCGTGNLTRASLDRRSGEGRVVAVDFSPGMIAVARRKIPDARVSWNVADARRLPVGDARCDRVFCLGVWPHFDDPAAVAREVFRVLRPGGLLHVWHLASRERINQIHAGKGGAIGRDLLAPAGATAAVRESGGCRIEAVEDTERRYLVTARRPQEQPG